MNATRRAATLPTTPPKRIRRERGSSTSSPRRGGAAAFDWSALRLVFEQVDGRWLLVGVVHDQWTT